VYLSVGHVQAPCKTAEPIEVPCGVRTRTGPRNYALDELGPALADMGFLEGGVTLGTPSERSERALRDLARGEAQNGIAPGGGGTSHPSHPLDPPLSGSSDEKAIPGRHLKAP